MTTNSKESLFYRIVIPTLRRWVRFRFRFQITGIENIVDGKCILAMNHTSNYDPVFVGVHTPRKMFIMAKKGLFKNPILSWCISNLGAFPVDRENPDVKSLKYTLNLLKEGKLFALFIEGTRSKTGEMQEPKKGVGFIVSKSDAPVVPTYIYGAKNKWFGKAGIVFGSPMFFDKKEEYEEIAKKISEEIVKLKRESEK